jgi:uncharacterized BrkB/YihY/UPF0761 family membrane protein
MHALIYVVGLVVVIGFILSLMPAGPAAYPAEPVAYAPRWGYGPPTVGGLVIVVLLALLFLGRI